MIVIDFETRSRIDIKTCGVNKYLSCPDFGVLVVALKFDDAPACAIYVGNPENRRINQELIRRVAAGELLVAHNVGFDYRVYAKYAPVMGWPSTAITQWACTQSAAVTAGLPAKLAHVGAALDLGGKDAQGTRLITLLSTPDKKTGEFNNSIAKLAPFVAYALRDVELTYLVALRLRGILFTELRTPTELAIQEADYLINQAGLRIDNVAVEAAIGLSNRMSALLNNTINTLTDGVVKATTHISGLKTYVQRWYPQCASVGAEDVAAMLAKPDLPPALRKVLSIRKASGNSSIAKYHQMQTMALQGRAGNTLRIYGTTTGRWAGRGIQTQNMPKGKVAGHDNAGLAQHLHDHGALPKGVPWGAGLSSAIRGCITAEEGNVLIVSDYNAIECRILAWLAEETKLVNLFSEGGDVYIPTAAKILGKPIHEVTKDERNRWGKTTVLGAGYQMGAAKFAGVNNVPLEFAEQCVRAYRTEYPNIPRLWYGVQDVAVKAVCNPNKPQQYLGLSYCVEQEFLTATLPSGRRLYYWNPRCDWDYRDDMPPRAILSYWAKSSASTGVSNTHTYGGRLVENACQAVARDVIANGILAAHAQGLKVVLQVHDEVVVECPESEAEQAVKTLEACLLSKQPWMAGLPLAVESFTTKRYKK